MKVPHEKQLEATFEVLAWLESRVRPNGVLHDTWTVEDTQEILKREVDRALRE